MGIVEPDRVSLVDTRAIIFHSLSWQKLLFKTVALQEILEICLKTKQQFMIFFFYKKKGTAAATEQ